MTDAPVPSPAGGVELSPLQVERLQNYLGSRLPGDWTAVGVEPFRGGQSNPTYRLAAGPASYVLRKKPPGVLLPSAHAIDREYRILSALRATAIPVPAVHLYCDDAAIIGTPFYIMEYVEGRVVKDPVGGLSSSAERRRTFAAMVECLAALHQVDVTQSDLATLGKRENYFSRQIDRWTSQYRQTEMALIPAMERLIEWLPRNIPADDRVALVHGDFRLENFILHPTDARILAVLDWELSTLGHPFSDVAYNCIPYHLPQGVFGGLLDVDLTESGIPAERDYVGAYMELAKCDIGQHWGFYAAFALFRMAAILQGVRKRAADGNASSPDAMERGNFAPLCAEAGDRARGLVLS